MALKVVWPLEFQFINVEPPETNNLDVCSEFTMLLRGRMLQTGGTNTYRKLQGSIFGWICCRSEPSEQAFCTSVGIIKT